MKVGKRIRGFIYNREVQSLEEKCFLWINMIATVIMISLIFVNMILGIYKGRMDFICFGAISCAYISYECIYNNRQFKRVFMGNIILLSIWGWLPSGGLFGGHSYYFIFMTIVITILFRGKERNVYIGTIVLVVLALIIIEIQYPSTIYEKLTKEETYMDRTIDLIINITVIFGLLIYIIREYDKERNDAKEKSRELEEKNRKLTRANELLNLKNIEITKKTKLLHESYKEIEDKKEQIEFLFYNDILTNLPNRIYGQSNLKETIEKTYLNKKVAIALVGIDNLKYINDTLTHNMGDELLKSIAKRLLTCFPSDKLSRLGGDEFMIILDNINSKKDIEKNIEKIMMEIGKDFHIEKSTINITCSIGIGIYPCHSSDVDVLYRYADIALMEAKKNGGNNFRIFSMDLLEESYKEIQMKEELMEAIRNDMLEIYYQPKVNIHTNKVVGCEALLRWIHPKKGFISPDYFIPLAEKYNIIKEIDNYVLKKTLTQLENWIEEGIEPVNIAINVSSKRFYDDDFIKNVYNLFETISIDPHLLNFEITETNIMENPYKAKETLNLIRKKGIGISLDDFGTGYSSLNYLKMFPIDILKIDKSFIDEICYDEINRTIVEATVTMAKALNLKIVAEGVEHEEQLHILRHMGCNEYQGYYFSKPIPKFEFEQLLKKNRVLCV